MACTGTLLSSEITAHPEIAVVIENQDLNEIDR